MNVILEFSTTSSLNKKNPSFLVTLTPKLLQKSERILMIVVNKERCSEGWPCSKHQRGAVLTEDQCCLLKMNEFLRSWGTWAVTTEQCCCSRTRGFSDYMSYKTIVQSPDCRRANQDISMWKFLYVYCTLWCSCLFFLSKWHITMKIIYLYVLGVVECGLIQMWVVTNSTMKSHLHSLSLSSVLSPWCMCLCFWFSSEY